jgi:methylenetetrahydrofolate--tRNA-(uracil-5-)-methyltransferase
MESAASGILAGYNAARRMEGKDPILLPKITMMGALSQYISDESVKNFQPMGAAFGIIDPLEEKIRDKKERYEALAQRSMDYFKTLDL